MDQLTELLLGKYNERYNDYVRLCSIVQEELKDILAQTEGNKAVISARVKTKESVKDKLNRKSGKYRSINEMTDIVGIRVVCYFYDQVDQVASIISSTYCSCRPMRSTLVPEPTCMRLRTKASA